jgi:exodeoxyribonuclease VIII
VSNPFTDAFPTKPRKAATRDPGLPADGIYPGVDFEVYHRWNAASNSRLKDMDRSPAYCLSRMTTPSDSTPAMMEGTATHAALFEPDAFESRYVVVGTCAAVKKDGAPCGNAANRVIDGEGYCGLRGHAPDGEPDPRIALTEDQADAIAARVASANALPRVARLLGALVHRELSILWTDSVTGAACKARLDGVAEVGNRRILLDAKRTKDAHPDDFPKAMLGQGIHRQLAWYAMGAAAVGLPVSDALILAMQDDAPFEAYLYRPLDVVLTYGSRENRRALDAYDECQRTGIWPAGPDKVLTVDLPEWAKQKIQAEDFNQEEDMS